MKFSIPLVATWAVVSAAAFWKYEFKYALPTGKPTQVKEVGKPLKLTTDAGTLTIGPTEPITVLDFTSGDCSCSRFVRGHVTDLIHLYSPQHVRFVTVLESADPVPSEVPTVSDSQGKLAARFGVKATPSAVILDRQGQVLYAGAYNQGRFCDNSQTAFVDLALEAIVQGHRPAIPRTPFYGCAVPTQ